MVSGQHRLLLVVAHAGAWGSLWFHAEHCALAFIFGFEGFDELLQGHGAKVFFYAADADAHGIALRVARAHDGHVGDFFVGGDFDFALDSVVAVVE